MFDELEGQQNRRDQLRQPTYHHKKRVILECDCDSDLEPARWNLWTPTIPLQALTLGAASPEKKMMMMKKTALAAAPAPAVVRAAALTERIRAKQASALLDAAAQLTPAERARRAALARAPELLDLLRMAVVSGGAARASQTLSAVVASVRASMRNPVGREEVEEGVRALAEVVAPRGVRIVAFGKAQAVVVDPKLFPSAAVVKEKLAGLGVVV
jgi:hypothetical protein